MFLTKMTNWPRKFVIAKCEFKFFQAAALSLTAQMCSSCYKYSKSCWEELLPTRSWNHFCSFEKKLIFFLFIQYNYILLEFNFTLSSSYARDVTRIKKSCYIRISHACTKCRVSNKYAVVKTIKENTHLIHTYLSLWDSCRFI